MENEEVQRIRRELRQEIESQFRSDRKRHEKIQARNGAFFTAAAALLFSLALASWMVANPMPTAVFSGIAVIAVLGGFICAIAAGAYFHDWMLYY